MRVLLYMGYGLRVAQLSFETGLLRPGPILSKIPPLSQHKEPLLSAWTMTIPSRGRGDLSVNYRKLHGMVSAKV